MTPRPITAQGRILAAVLAAAAILALVPAGATAKRPHDSVRFATFNASLNRSGEGQLVGDLSRPGNRQADAVAEIIQRTRPDVLLVNEFDFDAEGRAARLFQENYLSRPHGDAAPIHYAHRYVAPSNTGIASGHDLDNDGRVGGPNDAQGFGFYPGQYGMAVYSRHPIDERRIRTFQSLRWKDMPDALLPDDPATPAPADWYSPDELEVFRLSSKSHWDLPVEVRNKVVRFLVSHPTPPVFDGPEDRNGRRNHDEILLGRLRQSQPVGLHLRRRGPARRPLAIGAVRDRRRPERRPARRRQRARGGPAAPRSSSTRG